MKYNITAENVLGHEIIGLNTEVIKSSDRSRKGIRGKIWFETKNTLDIKSKQGIKRVPKKANVFKIELPSREKIEIKGDELLARPEDRTKTWFKKRR